MALQVTKVHLPERTRARLDVENDRQRAQKPHDIRSAIPLVDYTNPAKFPPYVFREYPKMPLLNENKPIVIDEVGNVLIFYEPADEVDFKQMNPEIADEIERNTPAASMAETLSKQINEIDSLRAQLKAHGLLDDEDAPKNRLAGAVRKSAPAANAAPESERQDAANDLRAIAGGGGSAAVSGTPDNKNPLRNKKKN